MKSPIITLVIAILSVSGLVFAAHAESGDTTQTGSEAEVTSIITENPLLVDSISTPDDAHIILKFNQSIISESVRVRVSKQSDESNVRIESFTGAETDDSITIVLSDILEPNTSYKMTIISAISDAGVIIKDGADGLKEFTTPADLVQFAPEPELNAPTNPNAVMIQATGTTTATGAEVKNNETKVSPSETTEELPLTGTSSTIFVIIAAILGFILVLRRRHA